MASRKLGLWQQVALIFFTVSGGAYGLEALVGAVGAHWALILVVVLPLLWAVPTALMVAELSSAIPEQGGYYVWVRRAMGPFWGFQEGWWTLCYSAVDMALYPVLFVTYLSFFFPGLNGDALSMQLLRWAICLVFIAAALGFNLRGSRAVGMNALANFLIVMFPFAMLTVCGLFVGDWGALKAAIVGGQEHAIQPSQLAVGLAVVLWNYCGWDNVSTYAEEVEDPGRNYPRSLAIALVIVILSYVLPMLAGFKATIQPADWAQTSGWPEIAMRLGGPWLGRLGALAALVSAWALFNSQLLYISRLPAAMSADGWLPRALARTDSRTGTPWVALVVMGSLAAVFSALSLGKLMVVDVLFYTLGLSLEFISLIRLREVEPALERPFRIPLGNVGLALMSVPPIALAVIVGLCSLQGESGSMLQLGIVGAGVVAGIGVYLWKKTARRKVIRV